MAFDYKKLSKTNMYFTKCSQTRAPSYQRSFTIFSNFGFDNNMIHNWTTYGYVMYLLEGNMW